MLADALGREGAARLPLRRARRRPHAGGAAPGRPRGADRPRAARLRPGAAAPDGRRRARLRAASRSSPSTSSSTPPATLADARAIAALIREGGAEGLPGVRAIGVQLAHAAQVSTNVEDHRAATPADVVAAVRRHAAGGGRRARRARARGGARGLPRGRAAARAGQRSKSGSILGRTMAQTKRKRRSKHRGNAAGTVEARGRTSRPANLSPAEQKKADTPVRARRADEQAADLEQRAVQGRADGRAAVRLHPDRPVRREHDDRAVGVPRAVRAGPLHAAGVRDRQVRLLARPEAPRARRPDGRALPHGRRRSRRTPGSPAATAPRPRS